MAGRLTISPRQRGWTRATPQRESCPRDFPAPAGMDPLILKSSSAIFGFPRASGDGPPVGEALREFVQISPRQRGWTPNGHIRLVDLHDFPAPAGMDPICGSASSSLTGFPRASGDGPLCVAVRCRAKKISPRQRGWTRSHGPSAHDKLDFPAPAGWTPARMPLLSKGLDFPAPAGMDPTTTSTASKAR